MTSARSETWTLEIKSFAGSEDARALGVRRAEREGYTVKSSSAELLRHPARVGEAATYLIRLAVIER